MTIDYLVYACNTSFNYNSYLAKIEGDMNTLVGMTTFNRYKFSHIDVDINITVGLIYIEFGQGISSF
jgi:hypothetical protein